MAGAIPGEGLLLGEIYTPGSGFIPAGSQGSIERVDIGSHGPDSGGGGGGSSVTEHLMRPGSGSLQLVSDAPLSITKLIYDAVADIGCHIIITPTPFDLAGTTPVMGDTSALANALYTGRVMGRPSRTSVEFTGLSSWLDTYFALDLTLSAANASTTIAAILALFANGLTSGTINNSGVSNITRVYPGYSATEREILDHAAGLGGWEYRVNPNGSIDAGTIANLFGSTPTIVITRKPAGNVGTYRGIDGGLLDQNIDVSQQATTITVLGQGQSIDTFLTGTATNTLALNSLYGLDAGIQVIISSPDENTTTSGTVASSYAALRTLRRQISVSSSTPNMRRYIEPGEYVYLYDVLSGLTDTANKIQFQGETIFPVKVRCLSLTWPIQRGYGVYMRTNEATAKWYDLTSFVEWEDGDAFWTVGEWSPPSFGTVNRSDPVLGARFTDQAWMSHTPQIDQGASTNIAKTVSYSKYTQVGKTVTWAFDLALTAAGSAGSVVTVTLPVTAAYSGGAMSLGAGAVFDTSTATPYGATVGLSGATKVLFVGDWSGSSAWGATPNLALASGDILRGTVTYEAA